MHAHIIVNADNVAISFHLHYPHPETSGTCDGLMEKQTIDITRIQEIIWYYLIKVYYQEKKHGGKKFKTKLIKI